MRPSFGSFRSKVACCVSAVAILCFAAAARAEDAFFAVGISSLKITAGDPPKSRPADWYPDHRNRIAYSIVPYVVADGDVEAYVSDDDEANAGNPFRWRPENESLLLRASKGKDVTGTLYVPNENWTGLQKVKFLVSATQADATKREAFFKAKERHYQGLMSRQLPGSPWFRYQARQAQASLAGKSLVEFEADARRVPNDANSDTRFEDTFQVFSGGRAVSENLQLDRLLPLTAPEEPTVDLAMIEGITVAEMDWGPLTKDIQPQTDPLSAILPSDQHALLFPSFQAMLRMMDEAALNGTPVLETVQPRSESARSRERYEKQLCLSVTALSRLLGDEVVASVAFTGSDPYLRTGTDLAILFEAKSALALKTHVATQQAAAMNANAECKEADGTIGDVKYVGAVSPDRTICSYLAQVGDAVVVTNSLVQLKRIVDTSAGQGESLASLPEYRFFRHRYQRGGDETGLLIVTDKTIRRLCSPKSRIATSRRTRATAIMAHYQAQFMQDLANGKVEPHDIQTILQVPDLGTLRLTKAGVTSSTYGTLEFQTPIAELDFTKVTKTEATTYEGWRRGYQQNWSQFFDPIAVSFTVQNDRLAADVTVMPLIDSSDYGEFIDIVAGRELKPTSGDPHAGSLLHWAMAINPKSKRLQWASNFVEGPIKVSLLSWLGDSISVYADADPFWAELAEAMKSQESEKSIEDAAEKFFEQNVHRLPTAFTAEVSNSLKLTLFLSGVRAFLEQTAPGMLAWSSHDRNGVGYVKITPTESGRGAAPFVDKVVIHYAATPDLFVLTLNEDVLKRALDRQAARKQAGESTAAKSTDAAPANAKKVEAKTDAESPQPTRPWLGKSMALQLDSKVLELFEEVFGRREFQTLMQARAWSNLAILNEWKRLYPDRDPVDLHQQVWQTTLVCPGGGKYVWNENYQTMESTVYGHPGEPKAGGSVPVPLATARTLDFGVTFENRGLRAKFELQREAAK